MKRIIYLLGVFALLCACEPKDTSVTTCEITDTQVDSLSATRAKIIISIGYDRHYSYSPTISEYGVCYSSKNATPSEEGTEIVIKNEKRDVEVLSVHVDGLQKETHYFAQAFIRNAISTIYGEVFEFTTPDDDVTLSFKGISDITDTSAKLSGSITVGKDAVGKASECGYFYSVNEQPTAYNSGRVYTTDIASAQPGTYGMDWDINNLPSNTKLYVRMYYKAKNEYFYSPTRTFTTLRPYNTVEITMGDATNITYSGATLNGSIYIGEGARKSVTEIGFIWNVRYSSEEPKKVSWNATNAPNLFSSGGVKELKHTVSGLGSDEEHYFNIYYVQNGQTYYGTETVFRTSRNPNDPRKDILGVYTMRLKTGNRVNYDESWEEISWYGIRISPYSPLGDKGVKIEGLYQGDYDYVAFGTYDPNTKRLTLVKTTDEAVPSFRYYSSYYGRYFDVTAKFQPIEWGYCSDCGVWSGSYIPISNADSGDFILTSPGNLKQGKSTEAPYDVTWYFTFRLYSTEKGDDYISSTTHVHDVYLTRTSTDY